MIGRTLSIVGLAVVLMLSSGDDDARGSAPPSAPSANESAAPAPTPSKAIRRRDALLRDHLEAVRRLEKPPRFPTVGFDAVPQVDDPSLWESLGPTSIHDGQIGLTGRARDVTGRVTAVKAHPCLDGPWLIGAAAGGIWRTEDKGHTWQAAHHPAVHGSPGTFSPPSLAIGAIAFSPLRLGALPNGPCPKEVLFAYAGTGDPTSRRDSYTGSGLLVSDDLGKSWMRLEAMVRTTAGTLRKVDWFGKAVTAIVTTLAADGGHYLWVGTRPAPSLTFHSVERSFSGPALDAQFLGLFRAYVLAPARSGGKAPSTLTFEPVSATTPLGYVTDLKPGIDADDATCVYLGAHYPPGPYFGVYRSCGSDAPPRADRLIYEVLADAIVKLAPAPDRTLYVSLFDINNYRLELSRLDRPHPCPPQLSCRPTALIPFTPAPTESYCNWNPASPYPSGPGLDACKLFNVISASPNAPATLFAGGIALWKCIWCLPPDHTDYPTRQPIWGDVSLQTPRPGRPPRSPWHGIHQDQQALDWSGNRLIVGNDGGVWSTTDGGDTWENHNFGGLAITQIYRGALDPRRPDVVFAGTQDVGTARRDGWRWRWVHGGDGVGVVVSHKEPATHWTIAHQSVLVQRATPNNMLAIWRTRDGGLTFQRADLGMELETDRWVPPFVQCPDRNTDIILFGASSLWKISDLLTIPTTRPFEVVSSPSWERNYPPRQRHDDLTGGPPITAIAFAPDRHMPPCQTYAFADWAVDVNDVKNSTARVRLTKDGGQWWRPFAWTGDRPISALAFGSTSLYATLSAYSAFAKEKEALYILRWDSGHLLTAAPINVTPAGAGRRIHQPFHSIAIVPRSRSRDYEVVFAGSDFGVWMMSSSADQSWCHMSIDTFTPYPAVMDLKVHPVTHWLYAFTFGRGVFRLKDIKKAVEACAKALRTTVSPNR